MKTVKSSFAVSARSILSSLSLVLLGGFSYFPFAEYIIPGLEKILSLTLETIAFSDIDLILVPIFGYLLMGGSVCLAVNIFKPLKSWNSEDGILGDLLEGLTVGLVMSLLGLLSGLLAGILLGFPSGLFLGFIMAFWGLIAGLVLGLVVGFMGEF